MSDSVSENLKPILMIRASERSLAELTEFLWTNRIDYRHTDSILSASRSLSGQEFLAIICDQDSLSGCSQWPEQETSDSRAVEAMLSSPVPWMMVNDQQTAGVKFDQFLGHSIYSFRQSALKSCWDSMQALVRQVKASEQTQTQARLSNTPHFLPSSITENSPQTCSLYVIH